MTALLSRNGSLSGRDVTQGRSLSSPLTTALPLAAIMTAALLLYVQAASGPAQWADGGFFLVRAATVAFTDLPNDALSHPIYHLYLSCLVAAVGPVLACYGNAVLTVAVLPLIFAGGRLLGGSVRGAAMAAASYALALPVAFLATRNEVYPLHVLTLAAATVVTIHAVQRRSGWGMFCAGLLLGMTVLVHQMTLVAILFGLAGMALAMPRLGRAAVLSWFAGLSVAGLATIGYIAWTAQPDGIASLVEAIRIFLVVCLDATGAVEAESYGGALFNLPGSLANRGAMLVALFSFFGVMAFGGVAMLRGLVARAAVPVAWTVIAWPALGLTLFCLLYNVADKFTFALPALMLLSMLAAPMLRLRGSRAWWLATPLVVAQPLLGLAAALAAMTGVAFPLQPEAVPFRNSVPFWVSPLLPDRSAQTFAQHYGMLVPPGATVVADYVPRQALRSAQLAGLFEGRRIVGDVALLRAPAVPDTGLAPDPGLAYVPRTKNLDLKDECLRLATIGFVLDVACQVGR